MKKTLKLMGLCALAVLVLAGCKKNEQNGNMTFKATISQLNNNAKTEIGSGNWLVWNDGDQIKVYTANKTEASAANFNIASGAGTTDATFSGDLAESDTYYAFYPTTGVELTTEGKFKLPVSGTQTFVDANFTTNTFPMCATATDGDFEFHSPYGILGIPMKGTATIGSIVLTDSLGMLLEGYYEMNDVDTTFVGNSATITLNFGEGLTLSADTAKTAYFIVPAGALSNGFKADVKGTDGNRIVLLETSTPNTITAETIHLMPEVAGVNGSTAPEGAINGLFSVSATKQVYFSQGNLRAYNATANSTSGWVWSFAENQWDYIGSSGSNQYINGSMTISKAGYVDLFCWVGTSASYDNYGIMYDNDGGVWGHEATNFGNSTNDALKHDWGHNPITNGGNVADMWRTPTNDEWFYLINSRTTAAGTAPTINGTADARFAKAKLFDTNRGLIIFPDTYVHPDGVAYPTGINAEGNTSWNGNQYSAADWAKMEDAGCVFLPCAGIRVYYTQINDKETRGFYASSTPRPETWNQAKVMQFLDNSCTPNANRYRRDAGPVRLVRDYDGTGGGGTGGGSNPGAGLNGMQTGSSHGW